MHLSMPTMFKKKVTEDTGLCINAIFATVLFVIEKNQKQPKCQSGGYCLNYDTSIQWNAM